MSGKIRLIACDLDGTLIRSDGKISTETYDALEKAAAQGTEFVPATGRFRSNIPAEIRKMPWLHYSINLNGALVFEHVNDRIIHKACLEKDTALEIIRYLDNLDVAYNVYGDNDAYALSWQYDRLEQYIDEPLYIPMYRKLINRRDDLADFIRSSGLDIYKIVVFSRNSDLRGEISEYLMSKHPSLKITTSFPDDLEINSLSAGKGNALSALCAYLGMDLAESMAFGDAENDADMVSAAGIGVAMENSSEELKQAADYITGSNDENGVAAAIRRLILDTPGGV